MPIESNEFIPSTFPGHGVFISELLDQFPEAIRVVCDWKGVHSARPIKDLTKSRIPADAKSPSAISAHLADVVVKGN
jgi:hypothetical protein